MSRRPTARQTAILVAMLTRGAPLIAPAVGGAFVPGWGAPPIASTTVSGLDARGLVRRVARPGRVWVLTEAGRAAALAAIDRAPEQRKCA